MAVILPALASYASDDEGAVFVVPVNADGTATVNADGSYSGQEAMTATEGQPGPTATHVRLDHGFVFLAVNGDASKHTFYTLRGDEVSFDTKNPMMIETDLSRHFNVPEGVYDITADADVPAVYYDMQGGRVADSNHAPGLYIARRADAVYKVLVR